MGMPDDKQVGGLWCHEVLAALDAFVDGSLPADVRQAALLHLDGCENCTRFGERYMGLVESLQKVPALDGPEGWEDRLAERLLGDIEG